MGLRARVGVAFFRSGLRLAGITHAGSVLRHVWVVECGAYEERQVFGVYTSVEAAVRSIKETFAPPYVVQWDEPTEEYRGVTLVGRFAYVHGYSSAHVGTWSIWPCEIDRPVS